MLLPVGAAGGGGGGGGGGGVEEFEGGGAGGVEEFDGGGVEDVDVLWDGVVSEEEDLKTKTSTTIPITTKAPRPRTHAILFPPFPAILARNSAILPA
jgi:hypothetical protein